MILDPYGRVHAGRDHMTREVGEQIKADLRRFIQESLSDQLLHAEAVAGGETNFRAAFLKQMRGYFGNALNECDDLANSTFRFLEQAWKRQYPDISPAFYLDKVEIIAPPTEAEIEDGWEVEIASSESAMKTMYEGSARVRKGKDLGAKVIH